MATSENNRELNVAEVLRRAKEALGLKRDWQLAEYLGVSRAALSNWVARDSMDLELVLSKMGNVDYNWLIRGEGYAPASGATEVEVLNSGKSPEVLSDQYVPLYNVDAAANLQATLSEDSQYIEGRIYVPGIPRCDLAIHVRGLSMMPIILSGDIIGLKWANDVTKIMYQNIYVVSYIFDDDYHVAVKRIEMSDIPGHIKLVSENSKAFAPMDIPLSSVQSLAQVKFIIRSVNDAL